MIEAPPFMLYLQWVAAQIREQAITTPPLNAFNVSDVEVLYSRVAKRRSEEDAESEPSSLKKRRTA